MEDVRFCNAENTMIHAMTDGLEMWVPNDLRNMDRHGIWDEWEMAPAPEGNAGRPAGTHQHDHAVSRAGSDLCQGIAQGFGRCCSRDRTPEIHHRRRWPGNDLSADVGRGEALHPGIWIRRPDQRSRLSGSDAEAAANAVAWP